MYTIPTYKRLIDQEISKHKFGQAPDSLYEPIRYLMGLGGKRMRPLLVLLAYSLFKKDVKSVVKYAVAVEAFHNFTLMHDDIMDNAPLRRGNVTVHEKWNVNTAILSGDVMLVRVYDMFLSLKPEVLKSVLKAFNNCAAEVCEGQQWDMEFETINAVTVDQYINMIRQKTAVLLGFSLELGGMLAGASKTDCKALREFGINIGIGFQLMDDLLDAYADPKKFGKQVGGDIIANKKTFLLITALERANKQQHTELQHWLQTKKFNKRAKVKAVKNIYDELQIPEITENKIKQYFNRGYKQLEKVGGNKSAKKIVAAFTEELIARQS
ncbi:MAG: polyprenyl synthetase family protein [Cyclobacteriaceae bacterium]|nr:polyprenyl synthetase family protein [Cyclobacteriaceae bacterium]UYN87053.1 MAG: polyprenyl synthetase family protein [Cyclobacteriaceae bacterium]